MLLVHDLLDATACAGRPFEPLGGTATTMWHLIDGWHDKRTGWLGKGLDRWGAGSGCGGRLGRSSRTARPTVIVCADTQRGPPRGNNPPEIAPMRRRSRPPGPSRTPCVASGNAPGGKQPPVHPDVAAPQVAQFLLGGRLGLG